MILTNCAACAAPLPRLAKQCSRCQTIVEQHYVGAALGLLHQARLDAEDDLGKEHGIVFRLMHSYYRSLWLYHFYGHKGYRKDLQGVLRGLLRLMLRARQNAQQTRQIAQTLCMVLTHQLDWSLDDLELNSYERQIVDRVLTEYSTPHFEIEL